MPAEGCAYGSAYTDCEFAKATVNRRRKEKQKNQSSPAGSQSFGGSRGPIGELRRGRQPDSDKWLRFF